MAFPKPPLVPRPMGKWFLLLILVLALVAAMAVHEGRIEIPDEHDPWAPLHHADPPNWLTGFKFARTVRDPARCRDFIAASPLRVTPVDDLVRADGCGYVNAVRVAGSDIDWGASFVLECPMAASLVMFELHVLQPTAEDVFGEPVASVSHYGSYACRNTYGREAGRLSQHARANALDISGFRLAGGREATLVNHWDDAGERGEFLHRVRDGACRWFGGVLGPDYNAAHADHFHFDRGPYRLCR